MTRFLALAFALCLLASPAFADRAAPAPEDAIDLATAGDIADAKTVSADMTIINDKIMACVKEGALAAECQCKFMSDLGTLKDVTGAALKKHPEWTGKVVNYRVNEISTALSFPGLQKQFDACK